MAGLSIDLSLYGQAVEGIEIPIGSSVLWTLDVEDPTTRDPIDLTAPGMALLMSLAAIDARGNPIQPPVFTHQADVPGSPINEGLITWTPGDTVPSGVPLRAATYFLDVWVEDADGNRVQTLGQARVTLTAVATLPGALVTPSPPTQPLGLGVPGLNWMGVWGALITYNHRDAVTYPDPNGGSDNVLSSFVALDPPPVLGVPPLTAGVLNPGWDYLAKRGAKGATGAIGATGPQGPQGPGGGVTAYLTVSAMRAATPPTDGTVVTLKGYYGAADGGGGEFYWDATSTEAEDGGTVLKATGVVTGRYIRSARKNGKFNVRWFGAKGDGDTHPLSDFFGSLGAAQAVYPHATALANEVDWAGIQAAENLAEAALTNTGDTLRAVGGTVHIPKGLFKCNADLDFKETKGVELSGCGGGGLVGTGNDINSASVIIDTRSNVKRFIDARSTNGFVCERLAIMNSQPDHGGELIDFRHSMAGNDTSQATVRLCTFAGGLAVNPGTGARDCINLSNAIDCLIDNNIFGPAVVHIRFREGDGSYSNRHEVHANTHDYATWCWVNAGEAIHFSANNVEGVAGKTKRAYYEDTARTVARADCAFVFDSAAKTITRMDGVAWSSLGWVVGMIPTCFEEQNVNTGMLTAITLLAGNVMTMAGATLVNETTRACRLYNSCTAAPFVGVTSDASTDTTLTFAGSLLTRAGGSWALAGMKVGQPLKSTTPLNTGELGLVTSMSSTVLSFAANKITFNAAAKTIARSDGVPWANQGFVVGMTPTGQGTTSNNHVLSPILSFSGGGTVMHLASAPVDEVSTTALVYVLDDAEFVAYSVASPGHSFTAETATSGEVFIELSGASGCSWDGSNWFGDQFRPEDAWFEFNQSATGILITGQKFTGMLRVAKFNRDAVGITFVGGNKVDTIHEPLYFSNVAGAVISGNAFGGCLAGDICAFAPGASIGNFIQTANQNPGNATGPIDRVIFGTQRYVHTGQAEFSTPAAATPGVLTDLALLISQGGGPTLALGGDGSKNFIQSLGGDLYIGWLGANKNTILHGNGFGRVGVGYPYHGASDPPVSLLQVNGAIGTTIRTLLINADTNIDENDSTLLVDASAGNAAGVLPTAVTCKGRTYTIKAIDVSGGTASVKTTSAQTIDGAAAPYVFVSRYDAVTVQSDGSNWLVVSKLVA